MERDLAVVQYSFIQLFLLSLAFFIFSFYFLAASCDMWDLIPQSGIEHTPSSVEVQSVNCWTAKEVPIQLFL